MHGTHKIPLTANGRRFQDAICALRLGMELRFRVSQQCVSICGREVDAEMSRDSAICLLRIR
jgi:hypothetical protein